MAFGIWILVRRGCVLRKLKEVGENSDSIDERSTVEERKGTRHKAKFEKVLTGYPMSSGTWTS